MERSCNDGNGPEMMQNGPVMGVPVVNDGPGKYCCW